MKHYSYADWMKYIQDGIQEDVRETYEDHLYHCDQCLEVYMEAMEGLQDSILPIMENDLNFTDQIMNNIAKLQVEHFEEKKRTPFYQNVLFQYAIAAAITLLFMTTGVFQSIIQYAGTVQRPSFQEGRATMTDGMVDKTFAWMDSLQENNQKEVEK